MKKKILLSLMFIVLLIVACIAFVGCGDTVKCECGNNGQGTDSRMVYIKYHYSITTQFSSLDEFIIGSLLNKPEKPTYINKIFNAGYGMTQDGFIGESDLPMDNIRIEPGYDANIDYLFVAWYTEPEFLYQWNFAEDRIYRDITLYAKWQQV